MKIHTKLALETISIAYLAPSSSLNLSASHISIRSRISASPPPPPKLLLAAHQSHPSLRTFLVDSFHQKRSIKVLIDEISRNGSCAVRILDRDGDWPFEKIMAVVDFLACAGRDAEALQVFYRWKSMEKSRASVINYSQIIRLFCENNQIDKAMLIFQDMKKHGIAPSVRIYNALIHGFARIKEFKESKALLKRMVEDDGLSLIPETYNGLIQAYGIHGFYDEMSKCVKTMEAAGCSPNEATYNTLIQEFSRGRLLKKMEKFYRTLLSNRLNLQSSTLIAMLEAYSDLGILDKMEKIYLKILNSNGYIEDDLIRKVANVYIENSRFGRLEEFGYGISGRTGRTELVWCILLLSAAGLLSRRGVNALARDMEISKVRLSTTFANIFALFHLRMKDFKALNGVFSEAVKHRAEPDMLTVCILFDARLVGYDCSNVLKKWRRCGYLEAGVEMRTDPLVLSAFGKGTCMLKFEKIYSSLRSEVKEKKLWKYGDLIRLFLCDSNDGEDG